MSYIRIFRKFTKKICSKFRRRRETPDDSEYAPYAGTGPGAKRGIKAGDQGDENLAYKAQLHQYQQAKQKIICGDDAPG